jgi:LPS-assembly protein
MLMRMTIFRVQANNTDNSLYLFALLSCLLASSYPANSQAQSNLEPASFCPVMMTVPPRPLVTETLEDDDIMVIANSIDYVEGGTSLIVGNAELSYNDQQARADRIEYNDPENTVRLNGDINYWDNDVYLTSPAASIDLDSDTGDFEDVRYWLLGNRGRGSARQVMINLGTTTRGEVMDYTTCDPDLESPWNLTTNIWKLSAQNITLDHEAQRGTGRNVILKIKDIPVFFTPYISFPTSERRKSGLLVPTFASSSRYGFELLAPYYWNISPQTDATITPRLITNSGLMLMGEYRYLFKRGRGTVNLEYLPDDSVKQGKDRSSISIDHRQSFLDAGRFVLNYNRVSDRDYLEDFSSSLIGTSTRYIEQSAIASYSWNLSGHRLSIHNQVGNYQIVDRNIPDVSVPYKRLPSTTINYASPVKHAQLAYSFKGIFDNFVRDDDLSPDNVNGSRYDLYPTVSFPIRNIAYHLTPKVGLRYTSYQLKDNPVFNDQSPDRFIPMMSIDSGMFFERQANLFGQDVLQTLEPRLYYLYVEEEEQTDLPIFDTGLYTPSFSSLFYENRFNGVDRFGDANQISMALTSRAFSSESGRQLGSLSLGQTVHLNDRNINLPGFSDETESVTAIIARVESNFFQHVDFNGEFQWDPELDRIQKLSVRTQIRPGEGRIINLGYRKHRSNPANRVINIFDVDQSDISFKWPINNEWNLLGRWNYAVEKDRTLDLFAGVEYNSCCWGVRAIGRRFLTSLNGEYETGFFVQIELKGLAGLGQKTVDFLRTSIPGYESGF